MVWFGALLLSNNKKLSTRLVEVAFSSVCFFCFMFLRSNFWQTKGSKCYLNISGGPKEKLSVGHNFKSDHKNFIKPHTIIQKCFESDCELSNSKSMDNTCRDYSCLKMMSINSMCQVCLWCIMTSLLLWQNLKTL